MAAQVKGDDRLQRIIIVKEIILYWDAMSSLLFHPSGVFAEKQRRDLTVTMKAEREPLLAQLILSYHQKYRLQGHKDLCRSLGMNPSRLQTSHLAARLNGYLVGVGGKAQFEGEVAKLGLSEPQADYVRRELERNEGGGLAC